jgi:hypothetical protein
MATIIDNSKKYFFHDTYGASKNLVETAPNDVIVIAAGWSPEAEQNRNDYLNALGKGISGYPSVLYWRSAHQITTVVTDTAIIAQLPPSNIYVEDGIEKIKWTQIVDANWSEYPIYELETKPWSWTSINNSIQEILDKDITV